jgi:hypothetical protein
VQVFPIEKLRASAKRARFSDVDPDKDARKNDSDLHPRRMHMQSCSKNQILGQKNTNKNNMIIY